MLQDMISALDDANGVTQDIWLHIVSVIGDQDNTIKSVQTFGGRYYPMPNERRKIRDMLPFMAGANLDRMGGPLALPAHEPEPDWHCDKCSSTVDRVSDGGYMAYVCTNDQCSYKNIKIRYTIEQIHRCGRCKGPFHPATGHQFSANVVSCGICYGKFICWQMSKYGWRPLTKKKRKKLDYKKKQEQKRTEREGRELAIRLAKRAAEQEQLKSQNPILER